MTLIELQRSTFMWALNILHTILLWEATQWLSIVKVGLLEMVEGMHHRQQIIIFFAAHIF